MRVLIVGAGLMGAQIGCEYALGGHQVTLLARRPDESRNRALRALAMLETHGLADAPALAEATERLEVAERLADGALDCDLAVESLPEDLGLKAELLSAVGRAAPEAILATNTSSIPITSVGAATGSPERVIGTHYLNPPLLMPPVEVIAGEGTSREVVDRMVATLTELGKLPVVVRRDVPGFVWNRLQFALVRECAWLVENGVADRDDIDTVVREGLARRWRHVGPLRSVALGGVDTWNRAGGNIVPRLSAVSELPDLREVAVLGGDVERDETERDARLAEELRRDWTRGGRG